MNLVIIIPSNSNYVCTPPTTNIKQQFNMNKHTATIQLLVAINTFSLRSSVSTLSLASFNICCAEYIGKPQTNVIAPKIYECSTQLCQCLSLCLSTICIRNCVVIDQSALTRQSARHLLSKKYRKDQREINRLTDSQGTLWWVSKIVLKIFVVASWTTQTN